MSHQALRVSKEYKQPQACILRIPFTC